MAGESVPGRGSGPCQGQKQSGACKAGQRTKRGGVAGEWAKGSDCTGPGDPIGLGP